MKQAQAKLKAAIDDPYAAVMVLRGKQPDINLALEVCTARAALDPLRRTLVWASDDSVLTQGQRSDYFPEDKTVAAVIGLDDTVVATLDKDEAEIALAVEQAFSEGGG